MLDKVIQINTAMADINAENGISDYEILPFIVNPSEQSPTHYHALKATVTTIDEPYSSMITASIDVENIFIRNILNASSSNGSSVTQSSSPLIRSIGTYEPSIRHIYGEYWLSPESASVSHENTVKASATDIHSNYVMLKLISIEDKSGSAGSETSLPIQKYSLIESSTPRNVIPAESNDVSQTRTILIPAVVLIGVVALLVVLLLLCYRRWIRNTKPHTDPEEMSYRHNLKGHSEIPKDLNRSDISNGNQTFHPDLSKDYYGNAKFMTMPAQFDLSNQTERNYSGYGLPRANPNNQIVEYGRESILLKEDFQTFLRNLKLGKKSEVPNNRISFLQ
jgi:hypothetical protein